MATLKNLKKSVSEMTEEELRKCVSELRASRLDKSKPKPRTRKKKSIKIDVDKLNPEEAKALIKELEDQGITL